MRCIMILGLAAAASAPSAAAREPRADLVRALDTCVAAVRQRRAPPAAAVGSVLITAAPDGRNCTFAARTGDPVVLRETLLAAARQPPRAFAPAKTHWQAGAFSYRDTLCAAPGGRNISIAISSGPKQPKNPQLIATVIELAQRDPRCDRDLGPQPALSERLRR